MDTKTFNQQLIAFLKASPTPFHATANMARLLADAGFSELSEGDAWDTPPGRYFVTRNQSSIVAFVVGTSDPTTTGLRLVGAHTDSPCLKVKPIPEKTNNGYQQLGVEVYGGVLLNPWFDRDLSLAGRITTRTADGTVRNQLINLEKPVAIIPSLAIHLDREANNNRSINAETDLSPVLLQGQTGGDLKALLSPYLAGEELLATDLFFYDTNPPQIIGVAEEFLASARLDNLLSCFTGLMSLLETSDQVSSVLVCNDHEEVGSASIAGAQGTLLKDVLTRILPNEEQRLRCYARSIMVSTDNAHGVHPNFPAKHENNHGPLLNSGPAIKYNANQRYATNSETAGYFKSLCLAAEVAVQEFVNRADMACGSTIGPITATELGIRTLDVGVPTFGMHSIRELAGTADAHALYRVLSGFFKETGAPGVSSN